MPENEHIRLLLKRIAESNDQGAYKQLFLNLHGPLTQFAYSILKSKEEAEELISDMFIKIWEKRNTLTAIETPRLYFYTTARNMALTRISRQKKQAGLNPENWLVTLNSVFFNPEKLMITEEILRQVQQAVNNLPPRCRLIFKLVKEDGLKYREVAELLQLSVKTVETQMAIALRRIGKCMHFEIKEPLPQQALKKS